MNHAEAAPGTFAELRISSGSATAKFVRVGKEFVICEVRKNNFSAYEISRSTRTESLKALVKQPISMKASLLKQLTTPSRKLRCAETCIQTSQWQSRQSHQ